MDVSCGIVDQASPSIDQAALEPVKPAGTVISKGLAKVLTDAPPINDAVSLKIAKPDSESKPAATGDNENFVASVTVFTATTTVTFCVKEPVPFGICAEKVPPRVEKVEITGEFSLATGIVSTTFTPLATVTTTGGSIYVKAPVKVFEPPSLLVTVMSTIPAG